MADDNTDLIRALAEQPSSWWQRGGDEMREKAKKGQLELLGDFARSAPMALMGLRGMPARGSMRPFNPNAPKEPLPKRPETSGDNGLPQHIYEAVLGRTRSPNAPDVPAPAGSGHTAGGWPKSPLAYLLAGGAGYGIYSGLGGPQALDELSRLNSPGSPENEAERLRKIALREQFGRERDDAATASPARAMFEYGGATWPWDIDKYGGRKKDPGVPPLPDAPY